MRAIIASVLLSLAMLTPTLAQGCAPTTASPKHDVAGAIYVVDDCDGVDPSPPNDHCLTPLGGKWVYQESNGLAGLQRRDEVEDNTCGGQVPSDTLLL